MNPPLAGVTAVYARETEIKHVDDRAADVFLPIYQGVGRGAPWQGGIALRLHRDSALRRSQRQ